MTCLYDGNFFELYAADAEVKVECPPGTEVEAQTFARASGEHGNAGHSEKKETDWLLYDCPEPSPPVDIPLLEELYELIFPGRSAESTSSSVEDAVDAICDEVAAGTNTVGTVAGDLVVFC